MTTLVITQGLPGSGKTTWARTQSGYFRVNRDDIRAMLLTHWPYGQAWAEHACTLASHASISALLKANVDVICDDTNLNPEFLQKLMQLGKDAGAEIVIQDFTSVDVEDCIYLDSTRPNPVGAEVIVRMWEKYLKPEAP